MGLDLMRPDPSRHGALRVTEKAHPVLRGEDRVTLRKDTMRAGTSRPVVKALVSEEDAPLLSALKAKRRALAEAQRVPAYVVFTDRTLIEMAERRPSTLDEMAGITGVGAKKLETYGRAFLDVIAGDAPEMHPTRRRLAGCDAGALYDRLEKAAQRLARGEDGTGKPMSCPPATLRHVAERRPGSLEDLARMPGMNEARAERFGDAFLDAISRAE
jgi:ATP-dependent DNA helicase RecQ